MLNLTRIHDAEPCTNTRNEDSSVCLYLGFASRLLISESVYHHRVRHIRTTLINTPHANIPLRITISFRRYLFAVKDPPLSTWWETPSRFNMRDCVDHRVEHRFVVLVELFSRSRAYFPRVRRVSTSTCTLRYGKQSVWAGHILVDSQYVSAQFDKLRRGG